MADEGAVVGSAFIDLVVRDTTQDQIRKAASDAQQTAQKAFSGVEAAAEAAANTVVSQVSKTVEHTAQSARMAAVSATEAAAASTRKIAQETTRSIARVEQTLAQSTDKGTQKLLSDVQKLEQQLQALDLEKEMEIHADTAVFEQAVEESKARIKNLKNQLAELNTRIASGGGSPDLLKKRGQIQGQLYTARTQKDVASQMLDQQRELAESRASEKVKAQQERIYAQLDAARQKLTASVTASAQKQAAAEIAAVQKTAQAAEMAAVKRQNTVKQAHTAADPPPAAAPIPQPRTTTDTGAGSQVAVWKKLAGLAGGFRRIASGAFSAAGKAAAGLLGKLTSLAKGFRKTERVGGGFASRIKEIASGALIFNGISAALQRVVAYFTNAVTSSDEMQSALADLKGAAANAASPIIQILTPALSALARTAATVFSYVAKLLSMLTGKVSTAASTAAKSASGAAAAAKKAASSLAGFDELQKLGGDGDDSGGAGEAQAEPNYEFEGKTPFLDRLMEAVEGGQWGDVGALIARKLNESLAGIPWPDIREKAAGWTQNLTDTINGFAGALNWQLLGSSIGNGLNTITSVVHTFFTGMNWETFGQHFSDGLNGLIGTIDWGLLGKTLTDRFNAILLLLYGFVQTFDFENLGSSLSEMIRSALGNIDWAKAGSGLSKGIAGIATIISTCLRELDWQQIGRDVETFLDHVDWGGILRAITGGIGAAVGGLATVLWEIIGDEWDSMIATWLENTEKCGGDIIAGLLVSIVQALANIGTWIADNIFQPFMDGFKDAFDIHSPSKVMEQQGGFIISGLLGGITSAWEDVKSFFAAAPGDIETKLTEAFENIQSAAADIWENGIVPAIKDPVNSIISCINGMISGIINGMNAVIRALNRFKFQVPDWIPVLGGKSFGLNIGYLSAPQIPMLASGGVITQPTLAMMGEYAGARNNPEIVAPQSILEETMAGVLEMLVESNLQGFESVVSVLRDILEAILGIEIDGEVLAKAVERYRQKMAVVHGGT